MFGLFIIWFFYVNTPKEYQQEILKQLKNARYSWVFLSILLGILSHISRAYRWNYLLAPLGYKPKVANNFMAVMAAYLTNLGIPRSGELLRAALISSYEKVPFDKGFGTIVAERVIDFIMLLVIIAIALFLQTETIIGFLQEKGLELSFMRILTCFL